MLGTPTDYRNQEFTLLGVFDSPGLSLLSATNYSGVMALTSPHRVLGPVCPDIAILSAAESEVTHVRACACACAGGGGLVITRSSPMLPVQESSSIQPHRQLQRLPDLLGAQPEVKLCTLLSSQGHPLPPVVQAHGN